MKVTPPSQKNLSTDLRHIRHVALGGGGAAGVAPIGAVMCLYNKGLLKEVEAFSGTSSGSILAAPLAVGYRGKELQDLVMAQDFSSFASISRYELKRLRPNLERYGIFSGAELRRWTGMMIAQRLGNHVLTFGEMREYKEKALAGDLDYFKEKCRRAQDNLTEYQKLSRNPHFCFDFMPGVVKKEPRLTEAQLTQAAEKLMGFARGISDLNVVASEVRKEPGIGQPMTFHEAVFNAANTPDVSIAQAVRASAAFPFFFRHAIINGKHYTDGGLTNLIPLNVMEKTIPPENSIALHPRFVSDPEKKMGIPIAPTPPAEGLKQKVSRYLKEALHYAHVYRFALRSKVEQESSRWWIKKQIKYFNNTVARATETYRKAFPQSTPETPEAEQAITDTQKFAEVVFGKNTVRTAWKQAESTLPAFWENKADADRVVELDRGNVESTDFFIGQKEKEWLLKSGYRGMEQVLKRNLKIEPEPLPHQRPPKKRARVIERRSPHPRARQPSSPDDPLQR